MTMCGGMSPVAILTIWGCGASVVVTDIVIVTLTVKALSKRGSWTAMIPIIGLSIILGGAWNAGHTFAWLPLGVMIFAIPLIRLGFWIRDACRAGSPVRSKLGIAQGVWLFLVSAVCGLGLFNLSMPMCGLY